MDGKRFEVVPPATGSGLATVVPARGAAFGDLDNDGRIDVVMNNCDAPPTVLRNEHGGKNHWLSVKLVGARVRDAVGAKVFLSAGGKRQRRDCMSGASYCSQSDLRLHFGLGAVTRIDKLEIEWPGGARESVEIKSVDCQVTIVEGKGILK
jgi:hypothetical protein